MNWLKVVYAIAPKAKPEIAQGIADAMLSIIDSWEVNTPLRQAHFLAQCAHESAGFRTTIEYASGRAYDHRKDLGFVGRYAGKGTLYKGFGLIQVTGPANQNACAKALGIAPDWAKKPSVLADFPYAALGAAWFWKTHGCNELADRDDVVAVTKRVNGGTNGLADRKTYLARAKASFAKYDTAEPDAVAPPIEKPEGVILPRARVASLQAALGKTYPVGKVDGVSGTMTVAAVAAFQHDNGLDVSGKFDDPTIDAIEDGVADRPIEPARAHGRPEHSPIMAHVRKLKAGAIVAATPAVASLAADPIGALEKSGGYWTRFKAAMEPFGGIGDLIGHHWPVLAILAAGAVFVAAHAIESARVADYQEGKTP